MKQFVPRRKTADVVFVMIFLLLATGPLWGPWLRLPDMASSENRALAPLPPLATWQDALAFPRGLELYLGDHFFQRNRLVHLVTSAKINLFGETAEPVPNVLIGAGGWLYYIEGMQDYEGAWVYSDADLEKMQKGVDLIQAQLKARGIPLVVVIAPNKQSIYPEYMPAYVRRLSTVTGLDQIASYFKQHASTPLLDLRAPLLAAKAQYQVYYLTDTHWSSYGAYVAWSEVRALLSAELPGFEPADGLQDYTPRPRLFSGDLAGMLTMRDLWVEETVDLVPPPLADAKAGSVKPPLVIFGDSFTWGILPFARRDFGQIRFDRPTPRCVDFKTVEEQKPVVVIWVIAERFQQNLWCSPLNLPGQ